MDAENLIRAVQFPISATTPAGQFNRAMSWDKRGSVELEAQDCLATFRVERSVNQVVRRELIRLGPGCSRYRVAIDEFATIDWRVDFLLNNGEHVDPGTGAFSGASTRAATVTARWLEQGDPHVDVAHLLLADGTDLPPILHNATTIVGFIPGYARAARIMCDPIVAGQVVVVSALTNTVVARYPLAPIVEIPVHPWERISITNTDAAIDLPVVIEWREKLSGGTIPAQECYELTATYAMTAIVDLDKTFQLGGPGLYAIRFRCSRQAGANATTGNIVLEGVAAFGATNQASLQSAGMPAAVEPTSDIYVWSRGGTLLIRVHVDVAGDTYNLVGSARRIYGSRASIPGV